MSKLQNECLDIGLDTETREHKADFSSIYLAPDPRAYVRTLSGLAYRLPQHALPVLRSVLDTVTPTGRPATVLDLCCSYGLSAAMLRWRGGADEVIARYLDPAVARLTPDELAGVDRGFYAGLPAEARMVGLDVSAPALAYARRVGLLSDAWCEDLEVHEPSAALAAGLRDVDVVFCTGGVGYIGMRTFDRILRQLRQPRRVWFIVFVLRVFDYTPIAQLLDEHGLRTERLPGTFPQRRFLDDDEQQAAIRDITRRGLDPAGLEADGWFHAECFVSRPRSHAGFGTDIAPDAMRNRVGREMC